jgi:hypothetical protein
MASILGRRRKEQKFIAFARAYLSEAFPNPERRSCPTDDALRDLARRPLAGETSLSSHLSCCSPCFNAYMAHVKEARSRPAAIFSFKRMVSNSRPALVLGALAMLVIASFLMLMKRHPSVIVVTPTPVLSPTPSRPATSVASYIPVAIDLANSSAVRGLKGSHMPPLTLTSSKLDFTLKLPIGSQEGIYTVRIKSNSGGLLANSVPANRESGQTQLHARVDLARLADGNYVLEVRSRALDLRVPILLKASKSY